MLQQNSDQGITIHYAWVIALTGALVLVLTTGFGRMAYSVILPSMKSGLSLTYTEIGLIATGNFVGYLFLALIGGFIAVRFGSRWTIFISLIVMGVSIFLTGLSNTFIAAFLMRFVTGMGNGGAVVPMLGLTATWFAVRKRGLAAGIVAAGVGIGTSIGGLVIPLVVKEFGPNGWRYAWFLLGAIVFAVSFICYGLLRDNPAEKGTTMCGGVEERNTQSQTASFTAWADVLKKKEVWKLGSVYFMFGFSYIIYMTFLVIYLTNEVGLQPRLAGSIFALLGFFSIASGIIWGWISDLIGRRYGLALSYGALALSCLILVYWQSTAGFYLSATIFGLTLASIPSIMTAAIGDTVGGKLAPAGLGVITLIFGIGQAIGPTVAGWLKDSTGTFVDAFVLAAVVMLLGAGGSIALKEIS
jgi:MFS family permease